MSFLHPFSILLEALIAAIGLILAFTHKKAYGWTLALTYLIYVIYDFDRYLLGHDTNPVLMYILFFIATVSMLAGAIFMLRDARKSSSEKAG